MNNNIALLSTKRVINSKGPMDSVTFNNGRCYFNGFNSDNDKNPANGKSGVNYFRYRFIGAIFAMFGLALRIHYNSQGMKKNCYLHRFSFKKWVTRHKKDVTFMVGKHNYLDFNERLNFALRKIRLNSSNAEKYIDLITENHKQNQKILKTRDINPGKPLTYQEVIAKAQKEFASHQHKNEIIEKIEKKLKNHNYKGTSVVPPNFANGLGWMTNVHYERLSKTEKEIFDTVEIFIYNLPGVDHSPYTGPVLH